MRLYQGDCLEIMQQLEDKSVDMVLCDLPYGCTRNKWDAIIPMGPLWEQYERIAKDNAAIVLFSNPPFTAQLILSNLKLYRYEIIWAKPQGTDFLNANRKPLKAHENIEVFYKHLPYYNRKGRMGKPYRSMTGRTSENWGGVRESRYRKPRRAALQHDGVPCAVTSRQPPSDRETDRTARVAGRDVYAARRSRARQLHGQWLDWRRVPRDGA
nr:MAG TPA: adenine-specific methyltransferase [Caudoviricetes sp.]